MKFFVLATLAASAAASTVPLLPAGVDPASCRNYPFCNVAAPAALPTPVVNGQNVAPVLNTLPDQTLYYQQVLNMATIIVYHYHYHSISIWDFS